MTEQAVLSYARSQFRKDKGRKLIEKYCVIAKPYINIYIYRRTLKHIAIFLHFSCKPYYTIEKSLAGSNVQPRIDMNPSII